LGYACCRLIDSRPGGGRQPRVARRLSMLAISPLGRPAESVAGSALCMAGCAKLAPSSRRGDAQTALTVMLTGGPQRRAGAVSTVIGLAEACTGAGMLAGQAPVRRAGPAVSAAVAGGAVLASRRAPERPCGCLRAASQESAAWRMRARPCRHDDATTQAPAGAHPQATRRMRTLAGGQGQKGSSHDHRRSDRAGSDW